eukprot:TRINITY_DN640_c0_g1_i2.p1 TRINITY_DN640_c0_g1~~TRINITY_DN640_c0_g1_i2.p1  ORF type:complete len:312 (-),score=56.77 TRINITY_DN640_c0_g1_i2:81-1016(-)
MDAIQTESGLDSPVTMSVIVALTELLTLSTASTLHKMLEDIRYAVEEITSSYQSIEVRSASDLFTRCVTRRCHDLQLETEDFAQIKEHLAERGRQFAVQMNKADKRISKLFMDFMRDDMVVLVHGYSVVVKSTLLKAAKSGIRFKVILTESRPASDVLKTATALLSHDISVKIIADTAVAHFMCEVDLVLVGAVAVVESGGILNTIGTYQVSMVASSLNTPVYCVAQSFKFTRLYPLSQQDIPKEKDSCRHNSAELWCRSYDHLRNSFNENFFVETPALDYTPPSFLTLLFTDLGVLTPSAVSDELIKLYS